MEARKILIITYYWPPSGGVGVQRWLNFALQLERLGWEPIILTPENPQFSVSDESLRPLVAHLATYKIPIWEPFQLFHRLTGNRERKNVQQGLVMEKKDKGWKDRIAVWIRGNFFIPDPRVFWVKSASKLAEKQIREGGIEVMITTGPPHSMHLVGRKVKKKTGVKWLADFRDPWSKWDILEKLNTSQLVLKVHRHMEASVLKSADLCTTVSDRLSIALAQKKYKVEVLHNGVSIPQRNKIDTDETKFTIGYFGMLNELRNPSLLWKVLDQLCQKDANFAEKLQVRIGGIVGASIKEEITNYPYLKEKSTFLGYLSHSEVQIEYNRCDMLLLLLNKSSNSPWILPVKFFEYLSAKRWILCLGPTESDLADLIRAKKVATILQYESESALSDFLNQAMQSRPVPDAEDADGLISRFSHKALAVKLDRLLREMLI